MAKIEMLIKLEIDIDILKVAFDLKEINLN
jgi:hypothetical protein